MKKNKIGYTSSLKSTFGLKPKDDKYVFGGSLTFDKINFKNRDAEKMNGASQFTGSDGKDEVEISKDKDDDYKVSTAGMRSSNAYFNLGLAAREGIEKKAKAKGYESYSDMRSKKKESRDNKKSYKTELRGIKKSYKKAK